MTITEFAILVFQSPPDFSDLTLRSHFQTLSAWQSESSGFPLRFFANANDRDALEVYLVTGWTSVEAHEAWIQGERNQELLRVFAPYVDMPKIRMVHVEVDFEAMPRDVWHMVIEQYNGDAEMPCKGEGCAWELVGRDLARDGEDTYCFFGVVGHPEECESRDGRATPVERWVLRRVQV